MSATVTEINATTTKEEVKKMDEIKIKTVNFLEKSKMQLAACVSVDEVKSTAKIVAAGIKHFMWLAAQLGLTMVALIVEYVKKFITWIAVNINKITSKLVKDEIDK